jgi:hypothetical protein
VDVDDPKDRRELLLELCGRQFAAEFAIKLLIENHPNREELAKRWHVALAHYTDNLMDDPLFLREATMRDKTIQQLANFEKFLR